MLCVVYLRVLDYAFFPDGGGGSISWFIISLILQYLLQQNLIERIHNNLSFSIANVEITLLQPELQARNKRSFAENEVRS